MLVDSSSEAISLATLRVTLGVSPIHRIEFNCNPVTQSNGFEKILGLDIGSLISVNAPKHNFNGPCYIEAMSIGFSREQNTWVWRIRGVQTPIGNVFTLGDPLVAGSGSRLDVDAVLGF